MQKGPKESIPEEQELDFQGLEEEEEEPAEGLDEEGPEAGKPAGWNRRRPESLSWARWAEGSLTRLGTDCPLAFRRRLLRSSRKAGTDRCGKEPRNSRAVF